MVNRSEKFTQKSKTVEIYSDFLTNFDKHPITNTLAKVTNEESIKQSLRNLIKTKMGSRFYDPNKGTPLHRVLFEPSDIITAENIVFYVTDTIKTYEPRVQILQCSAIPSPDSSYFSVNIVFSIINIPNPLTLNVILKRVR